jgi:hypothetical protein
MFCPEGYVSLYETALAFDEAAEQWWNDSGAALQGVENKAALNAVIDRGTGWVVDTGHDDWTPILAFRRWALFRFLMRHPGKLVASSPGGRLVRFGDFLLDAPRVFEGGFPLSLQGQREILEYLSEGHFHLEDDYFLIKACRNERHIEMFGLEKVVGILRAFEGWAVCWRPKVFDAWKSELFELTEIDLGLGRAPPTEEKARTRGRPRRQEAALKEYDRLYPNGHNGLAFKSVVARINLHGIMTSDDTLRRALLGRGS